MTERSKKIMIIDDNEDIVTMIKTILQLKGYDVFVKMNIINLKDSIKESMPNLIIMDMLLSHADGRVICKSLKNDNFFATIPILMISAHPSAKEECLNAGADMFLGKPFDLKDFFGLVEKLILLTKKL